MSFYCSQAVPRQPGRNRLIVLLSVKAGLRAAEPVKGPASASKEVISNEATVGIYNFREGRLFTQGAHRMIAKDLRVNGEFYVAPVYNELVADGAAIVTYNVGREGAGMYGLGIPSDLERFLAADVSYRAVA